MASTGFNAISQAAEILGRQLIDEKSRHFILDLLTRTLGENIQLQDSLIKKECEIEDLQAKIQEQDDNAERALGETAEVIEQLEAEINMINESRQKVAKQLTEKEKETEKHKQTIESLRGQMREKKIREKEKLSEIMMTEKNEIESEEEYSEEEYSEEEDIEEEPRRRYVAPTIGDPIVMAKIDDEIYEKCRSSECYLDKDGNWIKRVNPCAGKKISP